MGEGLRKGWRGPVCPEWKQRKGGQQRQADASFQNDLSERAGWECWRERRKG